MNKPFFAPEARPANGDSLDQWLRVPSTAGTVFACAGLDSSALQNHIFWARRILERRTTSCPWGNQRRPSPRSWILTSVDDVSV